MDKIVEALKKILPEEQIGEVKSAVEDMLNEAQSQLETEYNEKLEEAYSELSTELSEAEKIAEQSYEEAYSIIAELRNRLEVQGEEYKEALEEGYEEAYQMLKTEQNKNSKIEVELYEEYDNKLSEMKSYIVDKVDEFLQFKGQEIYEQAKRDVINDPTMAEHKVALDKIIDITSNYISDEDYAVATSGKLEESKKQIEEMRGQLHIMEARNIRLSNDNTKLNEAVHEASKVINEHKDLLSSKEGRKVIQEQNERKENRKNVTGRGHSNTGDSVVIVENNSNSGRFDDDMLKLAGVSKDK